jgi:hypothetical protein
MVTWSIWGLLVGGWILNVAVNADGATMDKSLDVSSNGSIEDISSSLDIDFPQLFTRNVLRPERSGDVIYNVYSFRGLPQRIRVT